MSLNFENKPLFKKVTLLLVVLIFGGVILSGGGLILRQRQVKTAKAAADVCNRSSWGSALVVNSEYGLPSGDSSVESLRILNGGKLVFLDAYDSTHLVVRDNITVEDGGEIWAGRSLDPSKYLGTAIKITLCGNGNFNLNGTINATGANNWSSRNDYGPSGGGEDKLPKIQDDSGQLRSEKEGKGGGGICGGGQHTCDVTSGSGGGGNGGSGGGGQGTLGYLLFGGGLSQASGGGGGGGVFGQGGPGHSAGSNPMDYALKATIIRSLNYAAKDEPENYLPTLGGRGGVSADFKKWDDTYGHNFGWNPASNEKTTSAGGGFVKIIIKSQTGIFKFGNNGLIQASGTDGQIGSATCSINTANYTHSTGGGAGGTVYIMANSIQSPKINVAGGSAMGASSSGLCFMGGSGGGGGGIIYLDVPNSSSLTGGKSLTFNGGSGFMPGGNGRELYGYDIGGGNVASANDQITKDTFKANADGTRSTNKSSTFNSGDQVYVTLSVSSAESLNGKLVTDEAPPQVPLPFAQEFTDCNNLPAGPKSTFSWPVIKDVKSCTIKYNFKMP